MSAINGDKARFNKARKQRNAQRSRNRELVKSLASQGKKTAGSKPTAVSS